MALTLIRSKARQLRTKTRQKLAGLLAGPLTIGLLYGLGWKQFPSLGNVLHPLFAGALLWGLVGLWFLNRGMRSAEFPEDAGLRTGIVFCKEELARQRNLLRRILFWSLGPILFALAAFILCLALIGTKSRGLFPNGLPFLLLVVVWIGAYFFKRSQELRALHREIDELQEYTHSMEE